MILIYIPAPSPRVQYIFDFAMKDILGLDFEFTSNLDFFKSADNLYKLSYGKNIEDIPSLPATDLLWQTDIKPVICNKIVQDDIVAIFETEEYGNIKFDLFASAFYLLTRYEEYLPCVKDKHGRYAAIQSIAFQYGFLETAMVNRYMLWFGRWLRHHFPAINLILSRPKALMTIDIDHPFYSRDVSLGKWLKRSFKEFSFLDTKDKYDTTDYMLVTLEDLPSIFFILCPQSPSELDHYNLRSSDAFLAMIHKLEKKAKIGLHPSYYAEEHGLLSEEFNWLSQQHRRPIKSVRFHYLRFDIESTANVLIQHSIQNDFSLGYGTHIGFRTSTTFPYFLFDLKKNRKTSLKIYTPCIMDSLFKHHGKPHFKDHLQQLAEEVKTYGGVFIPIFHNDIIADEEWRENFEFCVELMRSIG